MSGCWEKTTRKPFKAQKTCGNCFAKGGSL
jgi:hypothetical protein